jgi:hypothetical protein
MTMHRHNFVVEGLIILSLAAPAILSAEAGCVNAQLSGLYNAQISNINTQNLLQSLKANLTPAATGAASKAPGFAANDNSLSGNLPALGRYYFDGSGNIIGLSAGKIAANLAVGKYTVNTDCTGKITLASGAAYDIVLANSGRSLAYVRTDGDGGGNIGVVQRAGTCLSLNYPNGFTFAVSGASQQTDSSGATAFGPYSILGSMSLNGNGAFNMSETVYKASGVVRSTAAGTYTVGADCGVTFSFSKAAGANSSNFAAPASFRVLMVNSASGLLAIQPDANTTLTGTFSNQ